MANPPIHNEPFIQDDPTETNEENKPVLSFISQSIDSSDGTENESLASHSTEHTIHSVHTQTAASWLVPHSSSYSASIAALCLCMLTHSYLLISVFPYSAFMAIELIPSVNEENAGYYAGLLASSFMLGRATSSYLWGKAADAYGRTTVIYSSLGLSCLFSLAFGWSSSFAVACALRFGLGASNGLMGAIKTIVSELACGNEKKETRGMSVVVGMWGWGFLMAPAISGALARPVTQYPHVKWLQHGPGHQLLTEKPFLLPNLLGAVFCLGSWIVVAVFVRETLVQPQRLDWREVMRVGRTCGTPCARRQPYHQLPLSKSQHQSNVVTEEHQNDAQSEARSNGTMASLLARPQTRMCLLIYWAYSFVGLTVDETFPLFCVSKEAGFGLEEAQIGQILSLCGLLFVIFQYIVCATVYDRFGLYGSIRVGSALSAPVMFLMPLALLLNRGNNAISWAAFMYLALVMAVYRVFALVFFSNITVALNQSVPDQQRATMNGLSMLGGSVFKGIGPTFAGILVSSAIRLLGRAASLMMFGMIGLLGCAVMSSTFLVLKEPVEYSHPTIEMIEDSNCT